MTSLIFSLVQFSSRADLTAWLGTSDVLGITVFICDRIATFKGDR
ncbi:MAG: hypothetical protein ACYTX0_42260 [Nostoc sp.]